MRYRIDIKIYLVITLFICNSILYAESILNIQRKIELAKKIWKMGKLNKQKDLSSTIELKQFLKDKNAGIRKTAVWLLKDNVDQPYFKYLNDREIYYIRLKKDIEQISKIEMKKYLLNYLFGVKNLKEYTSKSFAEYEAAAILLIQIGNEIVPDILKILNDPNNIPLKTENLGNGLYIHKYNFSLIILKSIPDQRSIHRLEELSKNSIKYVSEEAKNTLEWIKSGIPYPFQYERILFSEDDIYPE